MKQEECINTPKTTCRPFVYVFGTRGRVGLCISNMFVGRLYKHTTATLLERLWIDLIASDSYVLLGKVGFQK